MAFSLTLSNQLCMVVEGFVVRDLIVKQAYLPRTVAVLLSYSAADKDVARTVFDIRERHGRTIFLAERSIEAVEFWEDRVKEALKNCRNFWRPVTPNSLPQRETEPSGRIAPPERQWRYGRRVILRA